MLRSTLAGKPVVYELIRKKSGCGSRMSRQAHTAQHLISALVESIYGVHTTSHHVGEEECYVEFDLPEFDRKKAIELQVTCNGLIRDDLEVKIIYPSFRDAKTLCPDKKLPQEDIRLVRIGNIDVTPCGCMHVPSLRYLQMLQIIGFEKSSRGIRIHYACGDQLLDNVTRRYEVLDEACTALAVPHLYLNTGISRVVSQRNQLQKELKQWKHRYFDKVCRDVLETEGACVFREYEEYTPDDLRQLAKMVAENADRAVCFVGHADDQYKVVLARGHGSDYDLNRIRRMLVEQLHFKGGGSSEYMEFGGTSDEEMMETLKAAL